MTLISHNRTLLPPPQNHLVSRDATNSLEDLLRNDHFTHDRVLETNALGSVNIDAEDDTGSQPTQEMTSQPPAPIDPSDLPLPISRPLSTQSPRQEDQILDPAQLVPHAIEGTSPPSYGEIIKNAEKVLEHIKNGSVGKDSRHEETSITYYDCFDNIISDPRYIGDSANIAALCHLSEDVQQRFIFVEDLSKPTIDKLGENFNINPEFFEEHLVNSGYAGGKYDSPPTRNWSTASFDKSYMSFRWIRPVYRLPTYFSSGDLEDLLEDSTTHFTQWKSVTTKVLTNIFRLEWGLWTDPAKTVRMKRLCGLEERVSIWRKKLIDQNADIVIVLLDPLPEISEMHEFWVSTGSQGENEEDNDDDDDDASYHSPMIEEEPQRVRDQRSIARSLNWIIGRERRKSSISDMFSDVLHTVIIEQIAPRQAVSVDLDCVFQTSQSMADWEDKLRETKSTKAEICGALEMHRRSLNLVNPIFRIIKQDTLTLLNQLRQVLDEIDIEILDDTKMEDRLGLWRQIINRAQRELPELRSSMEPFTEFLINLHPLSSPMEIAAMGLEITQDIQELWKNIDHIIDRLQRTSASLTSNMGLLDSRRSIEEAHAVARLTELAFIFVPMSFAASVFGMQIEPFANPVPISNFFIVAIVVTAFAYLMRMTMHSDWLIDLKAAVRNDVRRYAARNGQAVQPRSLPILLIFQSIASRLGASISKTCKRAAKGICSIAKKLWAVFGFIIAFVLLIGVASMIPLAVLWTREIDSNIQDAVSIGIVFIVIVTVGVPFWFRSKPKFRNALPDRIMHGVRNAPLWLRMTSIYLILSATLIVVPLALIWTRPLATGIKNGLTVGVVMIGVFSLKYDAQLKLTFSINFSLPLSSTYYKFGTKAMILGSEIRRITILLAGCSSSNSLSNIYLLSLEYTATESSFSTTPGQVNSAIAHAIHNVSQTGNGTTLQVRAGYTGICVTQSHTGRICSNDVKVLANLFQTQRSVNNGNMSTEIVPDPLNLIMIANEFKEKIVFNGLIYIVVALMFICILSLSRFPGWRDEVDDNGSEYETMPFPSQIALSICFLAVSASFGFGLISILWQHINSSATATMTEILNYGAVSGHVGAVAMALGWLSIGLLVIIWMALFRMKLNLTMIRQLIGDE
ncbi:Mg2+ transporter protein CorA-like/Zinc transport protein ZntB [Penicillium cf. viridicatum]|uniref:Mg2+ transporter protein CorA-like/Zinc transport protein ZntB n=1 Tax=Penicillium cf. viridicatum TaxID=2972119 RepID=A0A9W9MH69_9EURO|nr:Mg2+ transporter protein CorA-like/Zinc transport protein ZntB [Penicillium cf. viridicatum]